MNTSSTLPPLLRIEEAAALLGCHPNTVRRAIRAGELPAVQVGARTTRILRDVLLGEQARQEVVNLEEQARQELVNLGEQARQELVNLVDDAVTAWLEEARTTRIPRDALLAGAEVPGAVEDGE